MPYLAVNDFKYGMDRRRKQSVGIPGTIWTLKNAVVSRGGDIERCKKWVKTHELPAGTFGLGVINNQLQVYGSASEPSGVPDDIAYVRLRAGTLPPESGYALTSVIDVQAFDGKGYVIAAFDNGGLYHFYDGTRVTDWDIVSADGDSLNTVAVRLAKMINSSGVVRAKVSGRRLIIKALTPGVNFTFSTDVEENSDIPGSTSPTFVYTTLQNNAAEVAEVRAKGTVTITNGGDSDTIDTVTVDGVDLLNGNPVAWFTSDDETTNAVIVEINNHTDDHGYTASVGSLVSNLIEIAAAEGTGAGPNGDVVAATSTGVVDVDTTNMAGGINYSAAQAKIVRATVGAATYDRRAAWAAVINGEYYWTTGAASNTGDSIFVQKNRVWCTVRSLLRYCKLNDPTDWTDTNASSGAGFINIGTQDEGAQELYCVEEYNGKAAIFAENSVVIYTLAADAQNIAVSQTLKNTGTASPKSAVAYGADDVFYLDKTGIRSLRSRDGYDAAFASDIGSAIDPFIKEITQGANKHRMYSAIGAVETDDGRFFMKIGNRVVVLSYFPASKITAWSYIDFGMPIDELRRCGDTIYIRSGDDIYAYGGEDGTVYPDTDEYPVTIETPFMSAKDPATMKQMQSYDHAAEGEWLVELLPDPNDTSKAITIGRLVGTTFNEPATWMPGQTTSFALRFTCDTAGFASISSIANHFNKGEQQ